ncbi:YcaO-like family protein [Paenibacillus kandeliae]|uniref:YcaO-like family protein n=1 Tax=Paenibacillus kandeliae TaxID=3231269 RepID=UPI003458BEEB
MYLTPNIGTPFILNHMHVTRSLFRESMKTCEIVPFEEHGVVASASNIHLKNTIKAAIGEHLERISLFTNNNRFTTKNIQGINLATGDIQAIPIHRILLSFKSSVFKDYKTEDFFNDSCGLASHVDSDSSINSGFLECFERQSLIYNWLTKSAGKKIELNKIEKDYTLKKLISIAQKYTNHLHFFDISLHKSVKVIVCLGYGQFTKGTGVSAGWNYSDAIKGALLELFQYITVEQEGSEYEELSENDPYYYGNYFFKKLDTKEFVKQFSYLIDNSLPIDNFNLYQSYRKMSLQKITKEIFEDIGLDFIVCYIPPVFLNINTKIIKVLTTKGFPHMHTKTINPESIPFLKKMKSTTYPNIYQTIPFG